MNSLEEIDRWIIDVIFQKVAEWLAAKTGKSNFWFARLCFWGTAITSGLLCLIEYERLLSFYNFLSIIFLVISISMLARLKDCEELEETDLSELWEHTANPYREFWRYGMMRIALLTLLPWQLLCCFLRIACASYYPTDEWVIAEDVVACGYFITFLCGSYLAACNSKPRSRLRPRNTLAVAKMR